MIWSDMYIAAVGSCLPGRESTEAAVADGRYDRDEFEQNGYVSISVAGDLSAAELAVSAARTAVARAGVTGDDLAVVLHAGVTHQGVDHWTPASYIQQETVGGRAPAIEVRQASNGGLAALVMGMSVMTVDPQRRGALLTTADLFTLPTYDRYRSDKWIVLGDGAGAAVLSRHGGVAQVLSTAMDSDSELERLYRPPSFTPYALAAEVPLDLRARKQNFVSEVGFQFVADRASAGLRTVVSTALADAGVSLDQVARFVLPNVGRALLEWEFLDALGIEAKKTTWEWGSEVGHVGATDQFAGLEHLLQTDAVGSGDLVLLASSGIGFNWNSALLRIE